MPKKCRTGEILVGNKCVKDIALGSKNRYTPGPWFINGRYIGPESVYNHSEDVVATTPQRPDGVPTMQDTRNARIISASPELLNSLNEAVRSLEIIAPSWGGFGRARDAIKKAEEPV